LFGLSGCGYKGAPFYTKELEQSDDDVAFIFHKQPQYQPKEKSVNCE